MVPMLSFSEQCNFRLAEEYSHLHIISEQWMGMDKEQRSRHLERVFCAKEVAAKTPQGAEATLSIGYLGSGLTGFMAYNLQQVWSEEELVVSFPGSVGSFPNH